ncbi:arachidonate 5-lipoxygenase-like isoform X2 [Mizuhopecten yessoensis]|uniref:arachidonate 5-lipoxygenase-like isoform X2 n=1 Tax=Mizuhopecten yessoensis TaxID=6573 RepID=UPI000B45C7D6|nr:arachidonate 5-lipoxygenase-like isoform X2 [Mizuhopecten yessoensis]
MASDQQSVGLNGEKQEDTEPVEYVFTVHLGHKRNADADKNVWVSLNSHFGETSGNVLLENFFRKDFDGDLRYHARATGKYLYDVDYIKLWLDTSLPSNDAWHVHRIDALCKATGMRLKFPFNMWIKPNQSYTICHLATSIPTHDKFPGKREQDLCEARKTYMLVDGMDGMPPQIKKLPSDEEYDSQQKATLAYEGLDLAKNAFWDKVLSAKWEKLSDLKDVYCKIFPKPSDVNPNIWQEDSFFGSQRLVGANPSVIQQCTKVPSQLGVKADMLKPFLEGMDLKAAIKAKRIFVVDYNILEGVPCAPPYKGKEWKLCAPIGLFFVNKAKELMPIAIQLFQKPSKTNPVFLPSDPKYTWMMAKLWFNHADSTYQESYAHLGSTHLLMEGIDVVTHRNLAKTHPIFKLLAPHFLYLLAINTLPNWRMDTQGTLPNDLKNRKVEADVLPRYYFRDDAMLVYEAIKTYVEKYVAVYYTDKPTPDSTLSAVYNDSEIQAWIKALVAPIQPTNGGCGLKGVPLDKSGDSISTTAQLTQILTSIIFTCSVGHAVVNFPQYEQYGFQPAAPLSMSGTPPTNKTALTEEDIMKAIPSKERTLTEMLLMKLLSTRNTNLLGNFEHIYIVDPPAVAVVNMFRDDLKKIAATIENRNKERSTPYHWASPKYIPNAISI